MEMLFEALSKHLSVIETMAAMWGEWEGRGGGGWSEWEGRRGKGGEE